MDKTDPRPRLQVVAPIITPGVSVSSNGGEGLSDVEARLLRMEVAQRLFYRAFAVVVAAGGSWCAWLTNLLVGKL